MAIEDEVHLPLVAGDDHAAVDVVFFHGLGGHHKDTWTNKDTGLYWPEALHKALPNVRVWALYYPSAIFRWTEGGAKAIGNAESIADRVRGQIKAKKLMESGGKPCVWVCHSLGGLVAKHVLLKNNKVSEAEGRFDDALLKGIMFLGTPHRGSNKASFGQGFQKTIRSALSMGETAIKGYLEALSGGVSIGALPNVSEKIGHLTELIKDLEDRNDRLWSLDKDFSHYFGERWGQGKRLYASVVCEGVAMKVPPLIIVDKQSADPELKVESSGEAVTPFVLPLDHAHLAKPYREDSELFMLLRGLLARLPETNDPLHHLTHGLTGGQQAWQLAKRLQQCFSRPSRAEIVNAWRSYPDSNIDLNLDEHRYILEVIKRLMRDGAGESCLSGISLVSAFLKASQVQHFASHTLLQFCDEVVGWLALVCGAPSPFDIARQSDADELVYPGFASRDSRINDVLLATAHAHHKQWPPRAITADNVVDTATMAEIAAIDPNVDVRGALERWALGTSLSDTMSLRDFARSTTVPLGEKLTEQQTNFLVQHVRNTQSERKGIVLDARDSVIEAQQADELRRSALLPVLTVVCAATEPEGPLQQQLDQAIMKYRTHRASFLTSFAQSRSMH